MASSLSRRDFLKLGGAALLGIVATGLADNFSPSLASAMVSEGSLSRQGRVAYNRVNSYDAPSVSALKRTTYPRDTLLQISAEVAGGLPSDHNHLWYRIGESEYVHSAGIQPVQTSLNAVISPPSTGAVGEVTVPYTDSWWGINRRPFKGPRLYYATTHWIEGLVTDEQNGGLWYKAYDHLLKAYYFIEADKLHIYTARELLPLSPEIPPEDKYIEIRLGEQLLVAFEGSNLAFSCRVSTGKGEFNTPEGCFSTFHKRPTAHMVGGESDAAMYDLAGVPWNTYITENGVAMHGTFWHNDYGIPHSHGCINMKPQDARRIYRWTLPSVPDGERFLYQPGQGTSVQVVRAGSNMSRRPK